MQKKGGFRAIVLRVLLTLLLMAAAAGVTYLSFGTSRTIRRLRRENTALLTQYNILSHRLDDALDVMSDIQQRDDNLYRVLLMADPVSEHVRSASYASTNRYEALESLDDAALVVNVTQKMDLLTRQLYIQSESFNQVVGFFKNHEDMLAHLPAIQPISNNDLKHTASGYGSRIDPVYGTVRFHYGMDFTCDIGTPVFATADGRIASTGWEQGYGMTVEIDHGYGYRTRYCHLSAYRSRPGQTVKRGDLIALSGSTGKSTGPHVHYEVVQRGQKVNPVNFYFMDLDAEHYEQIVNLADNHGRMLD
ncbi:MAG: M23 family metallopeptidase [Bacteroidaceae bacterium]|nr:M23 family metallopeptidase [Bacteroidaceae bacterium]